MSVATPNTCAWLPIDTPAPAALDHKLSAIVADWSQAWFAGEQITIGSLGLVGAVRDRTWSTPGDGLMLGFSPNAIRSVGNQVLDLVETATEQRDHELIEEIGEAALADLRVRLAAFVSSHDATGWRPVIDPPGGSGWRFAINPRGVFTIALSPMLFATLARRELPREDRSPLADAAAALAATSVSVTAGLGSCRLALADMRSMAIGDILVLDAAIDDPVPIAINGRILSRGRCSIATVETGAMIEIVQSVLQ